MINPNDLIWWARPGNEWAKGSGKNTVLLQPEPIEQPARYVLDQVVLDPVQLDLALSIGERRCKEAQAKGRKDLHGFIGDPLEIHLEGACGEYATAILLGVEWGASINTFHDKPDVAGYEVKTRSKNHYDLIVRRDTSLSDAFILIIGQRPNYRGIGWIDGRAARRPEWWATHGDRPGAWFVPQRALRSLDTAPIPWSGDTT